MTLPASGLRTPSGPPLRLGELLGRGGEARVYALAGDPARAVKLFAQPDEERARKLAAMLARVPNDPDRRGGHVSIAWPEAPVVNESGTVLGFVMPRVDTRRYLPLHQLYHPRSRRLRAPGINWRYLVRIARNLSGTLAALHEAGYVVGDLNESNILVDDRALVTLVDLDSIQVTSPMRVFRCTVGKAEYTPPELQGKSFRLTTRRATSDRFGLAVLTFLLLMEGNHPFTGVHVGAGEPPSMEENIRARRSPHFGKVGVLPPPAAPPIAILGPRLEALLRLGLLAPAWRRPDPRALQAALEDLETDLVTCERSPAHAYRAGLPYCPWCRRRELLGSDAYPAPGTVPPVVRSAPSHRPGPVAAAAGSARPPVTARTSGGVPNSSSVRQRSNAPAAAPMAAPTVASTTAPAAVAPTATPPTATAPTSAAPAAARRTGRPASSGRQAWPTRRGPAGFRGSWLLFHSRIPLLTLLLLSLLASPALLWATELRSLLVEAGLDRPVRLAILALAALGPATAGSLGLYLRARRQAGFARATLVVERLLRAALAATLLSLAASLIAGLVLGRGSVFAGDWLLLPSLWAVSFALTWRLAGPRA